MSKNDVSQRMALIAPTIVNVPEPPEAFVPLPRWDRVGWRPLQAVVAKVPAAAQELATCANWTATFGVAAPPAAILGERLQAAAGWTAVLQQTKAWLAYVESQEGASWKVALEGLSEMKAPFRLAADADPSVLERFPAFAQLVGAQVTVAKRAAATRKRRRVGSTSE